MQILERGKKTQVVRHETKSFTISITFLSLSRHVSFAVFLFLSLSLSLSLSLNFTVFAFHFPPQLPQSHSAHLFLFLSSSVWLTFPLRASSSLFQSVCMSVFFPPLHHYSPDLIWSNPCYLDQEHLFLPHTWVALEQIRRYAAAICTIPTQSNDQEDNTSSSDRVGDHTIYPALWGIL